MGVGVACVACGGASSQGPVVGASQASGGARSSQTGDGGAVTSGPPLTPVAMDFRTTMTKASTSRFPSRGHAGGRWDVDVYADKSGLDALRNEHATVPVGTRFAEEHFERSDGGAGPVMMMEKRPPGFDAARGDWRYTAINAKGEVVRDGIVESCAGCHGEAPGDHLFRLESE